MKFHLTILSLIALSPCIFSQNNIPADTTKESDKIFEKVDIEASFPGGDAAWRRYLEKTLSSFNPADKGAPISNYTVYIQFVVDKSGNITDVKALTNLGYGMEEQVVKIIKNGPHWLPASQNGRPVKAYRKQPVTFVVMDDAIQITMKERYVLYTGIDNRITLTIQKLKDDDLELSISQGSVTVIGNGIYSIRVNEEGKAILEINNKGKRGRKIGAIYFVVKSKPETVAATQ